MDCEKRKRIDKMWSIMYNISSEYAAAINLIGNSLKRITLIIQYRSFTSEAGNKKKNKIIVQRNLKTSSTRAFDLYILCFSYGTFSTSGRRTLTLANNNNSNNNNCRVRSDPRTKPTIRTSGG